MALGPSPENLTEPKPTPQPSVSWNDTHHPKHSTRGWKRSHPDSTILPEPQSVEEEMEFEDSDASWSDEEAPLPDIKLAASKSPVMEALVYCALQGWGIHLIKCSGNDIVFKVDDFELFCVKSQQICSKQHPTSDRQARIKALKRWFPDFPNRREVPQPTEFYITIAKDREKLAKIKKIIDKNRRLVGVKKIRRVA